MGRAAAILTATAVTLLICLGAMPHSAAAEPFPEYETIRPNVAFWTQIYTHYSTTQAVIHDSIDLDVVYDVIAIEPYDAPGARKINRKRTKRAKARYAGILKRLAADPGCSDADCRRVRERFSPDAGAADFRRASHRVRSQIGQKDRYLAGLIRSGAYIDQIRSIFRSYGLPVDLAYLPHVESSFDLKAYSKFGAAGIWQFTRSTGRRFMRVGYVLDERRDPIIATHAAARLLKENHERLGSWPLAITAYNHGANGMDRAKRSHGAYPAIFSSYRSRTFKFASRNFYSEFLAARKVAADYQTHFGDVRFQRPVRYRSLTLDGYARLEDLSTHFGVVPEVLRDINPALRPPVFNGQKYLPKGYRLRLPPIEQAGGAELAAIPSSLYRAAQKPSRFYTVQRGDTAGRIARNHGVKLADLILANNLNRRATIYPRQTLRIPLPGEAIVARTGTAKPSPKPQAPLLAQQTAAESQPPEATTSAPSEAAPSAGIVVPPTEAPEVLTAVASVDLNREKMTAAGVPAHEPDGADMPQDAIKATRSGVDAQPADGTADTDGEGPQDKAGHGVDSTSEGVTEPAPVETTPAEAVPETDAEDLIVAALTPSEPLEAVAADAAETVSDTIGDSGAAVVESGATPETPEQPVATLPSPEIVAVVVGFEKVIQVNKRPVGIIQVEVEETLGHYAEWAGVRTQEIRRLNGLPFGRMLNLKQKVRIPLHKMAASSFEESRYEYHKRLQEDFFAVYRVGEVEPYRVRNGDNIWTLCREKFDIPMWLLKHYNQGVDFAALRMNQTLMVPGIAETAAGEPGTVTNEDAG